MVFKNRLAQPQNCFNGLFFENVIISMFFSQWRELRSRSLLMVLRNIQKEDNASGYKNLTKTQHSHRYAFILILSSTSNVVICNYAVTAL